MASSRPIAAGEDYTPDDINNLRNDVLDPVGGHKHNGTDGAKVPFSNLDIAGASGSTAPSGGSKSYNDLANHVASSQGAHSLNASVHVAGGAAAGTLIQAGTATLSGTSKTVIFPIAFSSPPIVTVTMYSVSGTGDYTEQGPWVTARSATQFSVGVRGDWEGAFFGWIAVGTKNP